MVEMTVTYEGGLRTLASHGPSGATVATDAPKDNEGQGAAFSPTDLMSTSLASCALTIMGIAARRRDLKIEGASAIVQKHMVAEPTRRIGKLQVAFRLPAALAESERRLMEQAADSCPVKASLHAEIAVQFSFRYDL